MSALFKDSTPSPEADAAASVSAKPSPRRPRSSPIRRADIVRVAFWGAWLVALVIAGWLHFHAGGHRLAQGVAETVEWRVTARESERLLIVAVEVGDRVKAGDVVAEQDPGPLGEELVVLSTQLSQAEAAVHDAELALGRARLQQEQAFAKTVDQSELGLLQTRVGSERDRAELDGVRARIRWWSKWVDQQVASAQQLEDLKTQAEVLERRIALDEQAATAWQSRLDEMRARLARYEAHAPALPPTPVRPETAALRVAVDVVKARLCVLETRRKSLTMRAPADGLVASVALRSGDVATPGSPVVVLRQPNPMRVLAFAEASQMRGVHVGQRVTVTPRDGSARGRAARVDAIGFGVVEHPSQLPLGLYGRPMWGEEFVVRLDEGALRPGQIVDVLLSDEDAPPMPSALNAVEAKRVAAPSTSSAVAPIDSAGTVEPAPSSEAPRATPPPLSMLHALPLPDAGTAARATGTPIASTLTGPLHGDASANASAAPSDGVRPLDVPASLRAVTRFEPSGWCWIAEWNAYLTVSDDTGLGPRDADAADESSASHPPLVFRVDASGHVGERPILVQGIDALDDVESVTRTADGSLWMLASQSASKRGRRPSTRTSLLRLRIDGDGLVATGRASLTEALASRSPAEWETLGLNDKIAHFDRGVASFDRVLDIEGMTTDGKDLVLGLKKPQDAEGRALLWRLARPDDLVGAGHSLALSPLPPVALSAGTPPRNAGISELLRLRSGALLALAVAGLDPLRAGKASALYRLDATATGWATVRLRDFAGEHAEGLSFGASPDSIAIVFDRGAETPWWLEVKVP